MSLNINQINNLILKKQDETSLASILIEYAALKQKLEDTTNHSWYFKKGIEAFQEKLSNLNNDFEKIRALFNDSTIDAFIYNINENNLYLSGIKGAGQGINQQRSYYWKIYENKFFNALIRLKSKIDTIKPIGYYLENPEEFLVFLE